MKKKAKYSPRPENKKAFFLTTQINTLNEQNENKPVWRLEIVDIEHPNWGWKNVNNNLIYEVLEKLKNYESMTWNEIFSNKKQNHHVPIINLAKDAIKRLEELNLNDHRSLYRLRFSGKQRVWGILSGIVFKILWWDEDHTVCPCEKKHT